MNQKPGPTRVRRSKAKLAPQRDVAPQSGSGKASTTENLPSEGLAVAPAGTHLVAHDADLLERTRTQWQFGEWNSLAQLEPSALEHHPDRAKLALLAAVGHQQRGTLVSARQMAKLALQWGCDRKLLSQVLIAGVHDTLGRVAMVCGHSEKAGRHFHDAIAIGTPHSEARLWLKVRMDSAATELKSRRTTVARQLATQAEAPVAPPWLVEIADKCLAAEDVHEHIDNVLADPTFGANERIRLLVLISDRFRELKDNLTALHFLKVAAESAAEVSDALRATLIGRLLALSKPEEAMDVIVQHSLRGDTTGKLSDQAIRAMGESYRKIREAGQARAEHGHELLLARLRRHLDSLKAALGDRMPVLVEIGTTRENVPGQGSTRKLAEFCRNGGIHFITVDMDPHNTRMATDTFSQLGVPFEAVTMKGEDYLRDYAGNLDFVFLDAYDFDHGHHSELRQSRYTKFLGHPIDDQECHRMHLDCAQSVAVKLSQHGLVCVDDTWLEEGKWTAKGTLAVPYLLENGFRIVDARNRAALLERVPGDEGHGPH